MNVVPLMRAIALAITCHYYDASFGTRQVVASQMLDLEWQTRDPYYAGCAHQLIADRPRANTKPTVN